MKSPEQWLKELRPNEAATPRMIKEVEMIQTDACQEFMQVSVKNAAYIVELEQQIMNLELRVRQIMKLSVELLECLKEANGSFFGSPTSQARIDRAIDKGVEP